MFNDMTVFKLDDMSQHIWSKGKKLSNVHIVQWLTKTLFDFGTYDEPVDVRDLPRRLATFEKSDQSDDET